MVFRRSADGRNSFLFIYWGFQFVSILAYSHLLDILAGALPDAGLPALASRNPETAAKIIVTPFNLITNFLFMKFLTRFMRHAHRTHA